MCEAVPNQPGGEDVLLQEGQAPLQRPRLRPGVSHPLLKSCCPTPITPKPVFIEWKKLHAPFAPLIPNIQPAIQLDWVDVFKHAIILFLIPSGQPDYIFLIIVIIIIIIFLHLDSFLFPETFNGQFGLGLLGGWRGTFAMVLKKLFKTLYYRHNMITI